MNPVRCCTRCGRWGERGFTPVDDDGGWACANDRACARRAAAGGWEPPCLIDLPAPSTATVSDDGPVPVRPDPRVGVRAGHGPSPPTPDERLVAHLLAAHQSTLDHTASLANARQRRRELAAQLHDAGHSYKWIGEQIGVTAQAVEGFVKYRQRRQNTR